MPKNLRILIIEGKYEAWHALDRAGTEGVARAPVVWTSDRDLLGGRGRHTACACYGEGAAWGQMSIADDRENVVTKPVDQQPIRWRSFYDHCQSSTGLPPRTLNGEEGGDSQWNCITFVSFRARGNEADGSTEAVSTRALAEGGRSGFGEWARSRGRAVAIRGPKPGAFGRGFGVEFGP